MMSYTEARKVILDQQKCASPLRLPLLEAAGLILAEDVSAPVALPLFDSSAMDGYALRASDTGAASITNPVKLKIGGTMAAGTTPCAGITAGQCVRIMTGAMIPAQADAVVMQENVVVSEGIITLTAPAKATDNIRFAGEETHVGEKVLRAGAALGPEAIGFLAALGITHVPVLPRAQVAIIATGSELVSPGTVRAQGKIFESNSYALAAALHFFGIVCKVWPLVADDPQTLQQSVDAALRESTHVLVSGGVSVGDFDYTRGVLQKAGVREIFWKIRQKPGKPLSFGICGDTLVFGLPGNPVSSLVCFYEYVLPALQRYAGNKSLLGLRQDYLPLGCELRKKAGLTHFQRGVVLQEKGVPQTVTALAGQNSHLMLSFAKADVLIVLPEDVTHVSAGERVCVHWLPGREGRHEN